MTDQPKPGSPLTPADVPLLVKGDLLWFTPGETLAIFVSQSDGVIAWQPKPMHMVRHNKPGAFTFLGRPDADGWIAWSGGDNSVGDVVVEVKWRSGRTFQSEASDTAQIDWSHDATRVVGYCDIIAFRLASQSTAPTRGECGWCDGRKTTQTPSTDFTIICPYCKGTGLEAAPTPPEPVASALAEAEGLEAVGYVHRSVAEGGDYGHATLFSDSIPVLHDIALVTAEAAAARVAELVDHMAWMRKFVPCVFDVTKDRLEEIDALLAARPLALGGQHSGGELRPIVESLAKSDCECDPSYSTTVCLRCKAVDALSTTPTRSEALDEGAAGEPVAWRYRWKPTRRSQPGDWRPPTHERWSEDERACFEEQPLYPPRTPTPSQPVTDARDADRVRELEDVLRNIAYMDCYTREGEDPVHLLMMRQALAALSTPSEQGGAG